ncbi:MAG: conjugal transfer protein TraB [Candidatus Sedimenticola endophacoides]|uniref:Conjugal transfer protein TraB n=2 Tax=Candidatus Sedimenticola endophacoides TaxID=2548426 RepID=A0A6N4DVR2_9GAMM|nr:MAG: conjugal transfer protein TraB [Candidatus Sedimenticola endophacoides]OQX34670.1 MAG: conjugal transfer protein TraB [Candidatus Sedimenticola endophacoides]OQX41505.1 MAG: conjugal transfer protein TraB [Candidatus Sedimenticola endophacoides]PUD98205.1 MAG: conjugal transfer protein TraB [Candidatus Sedimenticola endophacoides]PUE00861.1 MAG: conjugal transfer protein TraB [Candidatus Sedimenticola endophacoides]
MNPHPGAEPLEEIRLGGSTVLLLGTAHVSRASAEEVERLLDSGTFDAVAVELCPSRYHALIDPDALSRMDLFKVIREGKASMVAASLALGAYQQRLAEQFGIEPGAEQRAAITHARAHQKPVLLVDREIGTTLRRVLHSVSWWKRLGLFAGLLASVVSRDDVSEEEIERLKEGDMLETTFAEFAEDRQDLYGPLIDERDRYMAARLLEEIAGEGHENILVVIGAGHLKGIKGYLEQGMENPARCIAELERLPRPRRWPKLIPWLIVALVLVGFGLGFARSPELGWQLVLDWVLINGGLSALGALAAAAHPLTVIAAFLAAPLTSLNPTVGAGMVTAGVEIYLRRPQVGDFAQLRHATTQLSGWWKNRVSRTLLVFLFSTLGSAVGTYLAGFRIFGRLAG